MIEGEAPLYHEILADDLEEVNSWSSAQDVLDVRNSQAYAHAQILRGAQEQFDVNRIID